MAEFVLTKLAESVLSQTVERITEHLIHEAASLKSVRDDVVLLQDELESLQGFIKSADAKQHHDQHLQRLVLKVKDVASDAEDVIETYIHKVSSSYIKAFHNKSVLAQVSFVRERIKVIYASMQGYGITSVAAGVDGTSSSMAELQQSLRRSSPNEEDKDLIILDESTRALTEELTKEEDQLRIVSVVGMGGLGKTTLAKKAFKSVKQHFDSATWVFLSQRFVPKDVFIEILTQILGKDKIEKLNALKEHDLIELLKEELKEKRYLVVLDDIWTIAAWDSIKRAFPQGKKGSKLLFTTRNREVATSADPSSSPVEPRVLKVEESWDLLQRKAFPRGGCPPEFKELGMEMAQKCGGLPLAVIVLGGLFSTKSSLDEWKRVLGDAKSYMNKVQSHQQYEGVNGILALSYYDLPYYLKPCFLYLGNFPEDSEMHKRQLVRLWIGEGFIPTTRTREEMKQTLEAVAEGYLEELIHRCMVQVEKRDHKGIGVKTCRMHDLMRDLCISKAREESFAQIIQQQHESNSSTDVSAASSFEHLDGSHSRRLVIHPGVDLCFKKPWACSTLFRKLLVCNNNPSSSSSSSLVESKWVEQQVYPNLRSLLCLGGILSLSTLKSSNFRMLRVLELHFRSRSKIPGGIGNLICLRYLRFQFHDEISLPSSIGNLHNLHILDLSYNHWGLIGSVGMISRLIRLRHLLLPHYMKYNQNDFRIDKLKDIETLKTIPAYVLIRSYDALHKLTNLRSISISFYGNYYNYNDDDVRRVLGSQIVQSGRLTSLQIWIRSTEGGFPSLESLSSCHSLSKLLLYGEMKFQQQQGLIHLPQSLTKLTLAHSEMKHDPMPMLENELPNLRFLMLGWKAYVGSKMVCSAHGFPNLDTLKLSSLEDLREWIVEKGAMPSLKKLGIDWLSELEMIPEGLQFVTSLEELRIDRMRNSFCEKLQGQDYYKVQHIPSIFLNWCH
ncbi:probable disease resistance RPP8-like protein 2 isoform X1 [Ziziphus jujuba]|uniref:Probable disease resistance RPP8-like protein 2 isoform X1 n=1 Tax=Ziziphus jujuba TaxID=326968 RepID=A0ABM4AEY4_ZIZJJ|nr:probable disease resistance RPP8-like protein 2 isoform X1 [Ziziphus jujuba]